MARNASMTSLQSAAAASPPPIAALFLVVFDHRKGYLLQWHESIPDVEVEGVVEFKSLPSGLHNVEEDLVYFMHDQYAGISAYINKPDAANDRNASMLAVGVLVPLEHGRMGKSWLHAEHLRELAGKQIKDIKATEELDGYWDDHKLADNPATQPPHESTDTLIREVNGQADGYQKSRAMSAGSAPTPGTHTLAPHHPATTLMEMLGVFGPLIFPLYRAALLRKRILLVTEAPVEFACNIVYNFAVLSSLPRQLAGYLPRSDVERRRIRSLFSVGIQDIDILSAPAPEGWIACTTDDLLATKPELYDIAVHLPGKDSKQAKRKVYPKIVPSSPELAKQFPKVGIRASQRDAVRYGGLLEALRVYPRSVVSPKIKFGNEPQQQGGTEDDNDGASTYSSRAPSIVEHKQIVEPPSWSQVAYTSLLWWASAGDRYNSLSEEDDVEMERDAMLLDSDDDEESRTKEVVVVSYFRRLTGMMFQAVHDVLQQEERTEDAVEDDEHEGSSDEVQDRRNNEHQQQEEEHPVEHHHSVSFDEGDARKPLIPQTRLETHDGEDEVLDFTPEDVSAMGLDVWSKGDREFVEELLSTWWGRKAKVRGGRVECCGVRIL